ncbi:unnamed protein product [Amoebophrya sp. A120]|nr:unnamed protein product [Amoebophrya sp. A120]|eukprot:GSA120T00015744001.1
MKKAVVFSVVSSAAAAATTRTLLSRGKMKMTTSTTARSTTREDYAEKRTSLLATKNYRSAAARGKNFKGKKQATSAVATDVVLEAASTDRPLDQDNKPLLARWNRKNKIVGKMKQPEEKEHPPPPQQEFLEQQVGQQVGSTSGRPLLPGSVVPPEGGKDLPTGEDLSSLQEHPLVFLSSETTPPRRMTWEHLFSDGDDISGSPKKLYHEEYYLKGGSPELSVDLDEEEVQAVLYEYSRSLCRAIGKNKLVADDADYEKPENAHSSSWEPWPECTSEYIRPKFYPQGAGYGWDLAEDEGKDVDPKKTAEWNNWFSKGKICEPGCLEPAFKTSGTSDRFRVAQTTTTQAALVNVVQNLCVRADFRRTAFAQGLTTRGKISPALDDLYADEVFNGPYLDPLRGLSSSSTSGARKMYDYSLHYDTLHTACKAVAGWLPAFELQMRIAGYLLGVCGSRTDADCESLEKRRPTAFPQEVGRYHAVDLVRPSTGSSPLEDHDIRKNLDWFPKGQICHLANTAAEAEAMLVPDVGAVKPDQKDLARMTLDSLDFLKKQTGETAFPKCVPAISSSSFPGRAVFLGQNAEPLAPKLHLFELHFVYTRLQEYCELVRLLPKDQDYTASNGAVFEQDEKLKYLSKMVFGLEKPDFTLDFRFADHEQRRIGCEMLRFWDTPDAGLVGGTKTGHAWQPKGYVQEKQLAFLLNPSMAKNAVLEHCSSGWKAAVVATSKSANPLATDVHMLEWLFDERAKKFPRGQSDHVSGEGLNESLLSKDDCTVATYLKIAGVTAKPNLDVWRAAVDKDCNVWPAMVEDEQLLRQYKAKEKDSSPSYDKLKTYECEIVEEETIDYTLAPQPEPLPGEKGAECKVTLRNQQNVGILCQPGPNGTWTLNNSMDSMIRRRMWNCDAGEVSAECATKCGTGAGKIDCTGRR